MTEAPWRAHRAGPRPRSRPERRAVLREAVRDLPRVLREDAAPEAAAGMAFFALFSIFPAMLFVVSLLPWLPVDAPVHRYLELLEPLLPSEVFELARGHVEALVSEPRQGLLTASALVTLFSASRTLVSLSRALNRARRVPRIRSEVLRRFRSMALTLAVALSAVVGVVALALGDRAVTALVEAGRLRLDHGWIINVVRWPLLAALSPFLVHQLYHLLPDTRSHWKPYSVGAFVAVGGWVLTTWLFSAFAAGFLRLNLAYGSLGSMALLLAWMYVGSLSLIVGGSLNALMDRGLPPPRPAPGPASFGAEA